MKKKRKELVNGKSEESEAPQHEEQLADINFQICKCEQDILRDLEEQDKSSRVRAKYDYFVSKLSSYLSNETFYANFYSDNLECIEIEDTRKAEPVVVKVFPKRGGKSANMYIFKNEVAQEELEIWIPPPFCVPISADVRKFNFKKLAKSQKKVRGQLFDVIVTDPPWQLATHNPTRGVALGYNQLGDDLLMNIPFGDLVENGFLFVWVINAKYEFALDMIAKNGFELVDEVVWVKTTVNRRVARSHGFYLQHGKETCLVAKKGKTPKGAKVNCDPDVLFAQRTGQSQKPIELYEMIERLVPNGSYLEIFGRRNNLRNFWTTIGNEL